MERLTTRIAAVAAAGLLALPAATDLHAQPIEVGLRGGASFASVGTEVDDSDTRTGFTVGGLVDIPVSESFSIQPGLNYVQKGGEFDAATLGSELELTYLEFPVLLKASIVNQSRLTPHLYAGPAVSFELDCTLEAADDGAVDAVEGCDDEGADFATKGVSFGLMAGGGVALDIGGGNDLSVDVLYNAGLTSIDDDDLTNVEAPELFDVKNRALTVTAALSFPLGGDR